ncbi:MAG: glutathione synthase, partial [Aestuariivirgaceae bacterium]
MALSVAVQMDPIQSIDITGDSTFAMMLEAQARSHDLFVYGPGTLSFANGALTARGEDVTIKDEVGNHFSLGQTRVADLGDMDVV